jgi:hypothetical protein
MKEIYLNNSPIKPFVQGTGSGIVHRNGKPYYKIANYEQMPPFLMSLVSGSEHWMFVSSTGGLTCGRRNPDSALFPYYTDDMIHDAGATTGSSTLVLVNGAERHYLWEPFARGPSAYQLERNLYKNLSGNKLVFEEINHDLGLAYTYSWSSGDRFGFVTGARSTFLTVCATCYLMASLRRCSKRRAPCWTVTNRQNRFRVCPQPSTR